MVGGERFREGVHSSVLCYVTMIFSAVFASDKHEACVERGEIFTY